MEFGGVKKPEFERHYDGPHLGDITRLPRGHIKQPKYSDTEYLRSVHLCGEGLAAEAAETKRLEEELFKSKVVVDSLDFKVGNFLQIDRPSQTDRNEDILHGPVKSKALRIVRNAKLPSGKSVKLRPPPYSIFSQGEYIEGHDFSQDLRTYAGEFTGPPAVGMLKDVLAPLCKTIDVDGEEVVDPRCAASAANQRGLGTVLLLPAGLAVCAALIWFASAGRSCGARRGAAATDSGRLTELTRDSDAGHSAVRDGAPPYYRSEPDEASGPASPASGWVSSPLHL